MFALPFLPLKQKMLGFSDGNTNSISPMVTATQASVTYLKPISRTLKVNCKIMSHYQALKNTHMLFSVPQIEYTLGSTGKMGNHVYFLLIVAMVQLL